MSPTRNLLLQTASVFAVLSVGVALVCYDCYGTGPTHRDCTRSRNCSGGACLIFEAGDNVTSTAFCLMNIKPLSGSKKEPQAGCWLEPDGVGKHCLCTTDFCNPLRDRTLAKNSDPFSSPIADLPFLKHNPLLDYDEEDESDEFEGSKAGPSNVLFPAAAEIDPKIAGDFQDDDDLTPIDFNDYQNSEKANREENAIGGEQNARTARDGEANTAFARLPSYVVLLATMSASLARFLSNFL